MNRGTLELRVNEWMDGAILAASFSWAEYKPMPTTPEEMSLALQLRWFMANSKVRAALEIDKDRARGDYWLGSYNLGGRNPFLYMFKHTPTQDEMDLMEKRVKASFPHTRLIRCHFCEDRIVADNWDGEYFCSGCMELIPARQSNRFGYVYVFGSVAEGYFKIGQSNWPELRLKKFQREKTPFPIEMIHTIPADDKRKAEAELHRLFRAERSNGEWFKLTPEQLAKITALRGYQSGRWVE